MANIETAKGSKSGLGRVLRAGLLSSTAVVAVAASLVLLASEVALAIPIVVGQQITNPATGALETVDRDLGSGWALTKVTVGSVTQYNAILVNPPAALNSTYVSGGVTYKVISETRDPVTNLILDFKVENETDSSHLKAGAVVSKAP